MTRPPSSPKPPAFLAWIVAFAVISGLLLVLALLPTGSGAILLVGVALLGMFGAAVRAGANPVRIFKRLLRRFIKPREIATDRPLAEDKTLPRWQALLEIASIIALALLLTSAWWTSDDGFRLSGYESEWLTNSAFLASMTLREHGYLPLWQPYMEFGEPLVHNPFGFVLNPFSFVPSWLLGAQHGVKISVVITAMIAGVGGWFMGRVLGFSVWGRLLLAALMLGKGNMHAMIGNGYYQLGVAQAYFPWVVGGTLAILRLPGRRWTIALTALSFTLMFFAGNLWYTLPIIITLALLTITHVFHIKKPYVDWGALRRLTLAGAFTVGLSAIVLIPLWSEHKRLGGHPDDLTAGFEMAMPLRHAFGLAFDYTPQWAWRDTVIEGMLPLPADQFLYSYVTPTWFALLIFVFLPPIYPFLHRPGVRQSWRIWIPALILIAFFVAWGAGNTSFFVWLYNTIPGLGQWRFVGRAFAMSSFWIGVLVAWRFDALLRAVIYDVSTYLVSSLQAGIAKIPVAVRDAIVMLAGGAVGFATGLLLFTLWAQLNRQLWLWSIEARIFLSLGFIVGVFVTYRIRVSSISGEPAPRWFALIRAVPVLMMLISGTLAGWDVAVRWQEFALPSLTYDEEIHDIYCVRWLREQYPDRPLSVWRSGYEIVNEFQTLHVRLSNIASDYFPIEETPTVGDVIFLPDRLLGEFAIPGYPNERAFLIDAGYRLVVGSPRHPDGVPCLYQNTNVLPYAFAVPARRAVTLPEVPPRSMGVAIDTVEQYPGVVFVAVQNPLDELTVMTIQERAYPGWTVTMDGQPVQLETYIGQLAVALPEDSEMHIFKFEYRPPLLMLGGVVTLFTAAAFIFYLLMPKRKGSAVRPAKADDLAPAQEDSSAAS